MPWLQRNLTLPPLARGAHLITAEIERALPELRDYTVGLLHVFLQHTSAALTINENADPDVRHDLMLALDRLVPESLPFRHTDEGPDDMTAHVKASLLGASLSIPVTNGRLALGTWQGIYLCEARAGRHARRLVLTVQGERAAG